MPVEIIAVELIDYRRWEGLVLDGDTVHACYLGGPDRGCDCDDGRSVQPGTCVHLDAVLRVVQGIWRQHQARKQKQGA